MTEPDPAALQNFLANLIQAGKQDADLVLMQLDPEPARLLELCAIPHMFDRALVSVLDPRAPPELIDEFWAEVETLPSIRQVGPCLALHDTVREQLFRRWLEPERRETFAAASARLAAHYGAVRDAGNCQADEAVVVFHRLGADLESGFASFRQLYGRYREASRFSACESLVRLAAEYRPVLNGTQRAWIGLYEAIAAQDGRELGNAVAQLTALLHEDLDPELAVRVRVQLSAALRGLRRHDAASDQAQRALALATASQEGGAVLHRVHHELGLIARDQGDVEAAIDHFRRAFELSQATGNRMIATSAQNSLGTLLQRFDPAQAITVLEPLAAQLTDATDAMRRAQLLNNLGLAYANVSNWPKARGAFEESLTIKRAAGDLYAQALTLLNVARVDRAENQLFAARNALTESARLFLALNQTGRAAVAEQELARVLRLSHETEEAARHASAAIELFQQAGRTAEADLLKREFRLGRRQPWNWFSI